jgi:hypothetical protein
MNYIFGWIFTFFFFGGAVLWFATDFNRRVQAVTSMAQFGLGVMQIRAWLHSKRDLKQVNADS